MNKLKLILFILTIKSKEWEVIKKRQQSKGLTKYGKTLKECKKEDYNWREMALEEIFDCSEYLNMLY